MKNWFGMEPHPSDSIVHWSERTTSKEFKQRIKKIRIAWDILHSTKELREASELIQEQTDNFVRSCEGELGAGECF
jgi:hypothetical protein